MYNFTLDFAVYDRTTNKGACYTVLECTRTDGTTPVTIQFTTPLNAEDPELSPLSIASSFSGNNLIYTVTGNVASTINWQVVGTYVKAS